MSKRDLKVYIKGLKKRQLEEQIIDLYERFKDVKAFYDFAFNPKEDKLLEESKFKISKEYFPVSRRKAKLRRSVAQKIIKNCYVLQVDPQVIMEIMLFNIEIAITYNEEKSITQEAFYKSILKSFEEALAYAQSNAMLSDNEKRFKLIVNNIVIQRWFNYLAFENYLDNYYS